MSNRDPDDVVAVAVRGLARQVELQTLITLALSIPQREPGQFVDVSWGTRLLTARSMLNDGRRSLESQ